MVAAPVSPLCWLVATDVGSLITAMLRRDPAMR